MIYPNKMNNSFWPKGPTGLLKLSNYDVDYLPFPHSRNNFQLKILRMIKMIMITKNKILSALRHFLLVLG